MNLLKEIYDIIKDEIEPYRPVVAKLLEFSVIPLIIAIVSVLTGAVCSLIFRSFTDYRPMNNEGYIFWCFVITLTMYGILHVIRAYQLYARSGILNDPKYQDFVNEYREWLLKVSTGGRALRVALITLAVSIFFTVFDFDLRVQIGSWTTAIDSRAFVLAAIAIYCCSSWVELGRAIKGWIKCREILNRRYGV